MLRLIVAPVAAVLLAALAGCTPLPEMAPERPLTAEAGYRLLFNGALVGNALFILQIQAGGGYLIEAFTTPAGKMQQTAGHEVFETSRGAIEADRIRPQRFDHSVMEGERVQAVNLVFDWNQQALRLLGENQSRTVALLPDTHDRLSYLLAARRLASAGTGARQIQIASPNATEQTRLEVMEEALVEVPAGRYRAVGIRRISAETGAQRSLWFAPDVSPLPLRVVHRWDDNTVEMVMETLAQSAPE
jgi:hypothetical protein